MFVSDNSVKSARIYFSRRLEKHFSTSEIRFMFNQSLKLRLNLSSTDLVLADGLKLSESDLLYFRNIVKRLKNYEPFQYIIGLTEFYGLEIKCDKRALIPRPETEELVDLIRKDFKQELNTLRFIDFCSGSGCIALALKSALKNSEAFGVDISKDAIDLSCENSKNLNLDVTFIEGNVFLDVLNPDNGKFDFIVSNPPYIPHADKSEINRNVLDFEPEIALFVDNNDPLMFYTRITQISKNLLNSNGKLYFEIHERYGNEVIEVLKKEGFSAVKLFQDLQGKDRIVCASI